MEPVAGRGPDAKLLGGGRGNQVALRAERSPQRNGRVYRIRLVVLDPGGERCSGVARVSVPRWHGQTAIDDGDNRSWDSVSGAME